MIADSHQHEQFDHVLAEHRHLRRIIQRLRNLLFEQQESGFVVGGLLEELRDSVEEGEIPEGAWPTLTKSFEQFVVDFVQHEEHENQLLQETYFRDETAGD